MRKLTLALSAASLAIAGAAFAEPSAQASTAPQGGWTHGHSHAQAPLTRADAAARADKLFAKLDVNGDGKLDQADRDARRDQRFAKLDTDGNGAISRAEFDAAASKLHDRFAARKQDADGQDATGHKFGARQASWGGHRGMRGHAGGLAMMGKRADTNGDGAISKDEFRSTALAMFDRADANGDGTVTPEERQQLRAAHRGPRQGEPAAPASE